VGRAEEWQPVQSFDRNSLSIITLPVRRIPRRKDLLVAHTAADCPRAISALCPHRRLRLVEYARAGQLPGTIVCSAHRCVFDVATGCCVNAHELSESVPSLQTWDLVEADDGMWHLKEYGTEHP
jgi:nitrite reductase/ring-hydroxylating ferredoxin subunit